MFPVRRQLTWAVALALILTPALAWPRTVTAVRLGLHPDHTRLVVDLDGPFSYRLERPDEERLVILFNQTRLARARGLDKPGLGRVSRVKADQKGEGLALEVFLTGPSRINPFAWREANRLVVEVQPRPVAEKIPAQSRPQAAAETEAEPGLGPAEALGYLLSGQKSDLPQPLPSRPEPRVEPAPPRAAAGKGGAVQPQPAEPVFRQAVPKPTPPAGPAEVAARAKALAGAAMDESGRARVQAEQALDEGREMLKRGLYREAAARLAEVEALLGQGDLVGQALYALGDALFMQFQETGQPGYDQVERAYQKAIGAQPGAAEAARALLRMGIVNHTAGNLDKSSGYFGLVIKDHPLSPEAIDARYYLGRVYLDQGKVEPAIRLLRTVAYEHPLHPRVKEASWYLARVLFEIGRYLEARELLDELSRRWPDFYLEEPMVLYYQGETEFRLNQPAEARRHLYWILNIHPQVPNPDLLLARIGDTYKLERQFAKAAAAYAEAEKRYPESEGALIARIRLAEIGDLTAGQQERLARVLDIEASGQAVETYKEIAQKYPDKAVAQLALLKLGAWYYSKEDYVQALDTLRQLLQRYPETEFLRDATYALRQAFDKQIHLLAAKGRPIECVALYSSFEEELPRELRERYYKILGQAYGQLKLYAKAVQYYEKALPHDPNDQELLLGLAEAYFQEGSFEPAVETMTRFLGLYPAHGRANQMRLLLGRGLARLGRYTEAVKALKEAEAKGAGAEAYWSAAIYAAEGLVKDRRYQEAFDLLSGSLAQAPAEIRGRGRLSTLLGEACLGLGRFKEAAEFLARGLDGVPAEGEALGLYYRLGQAYFGAGESQKARQVLGQVAESADPFWKKLAGDRLMVAEVSAKLVGRQEVPKP